MSLNIRITCDATWRLGHGCPRFFETPGTPPEDTLHVIAYSCNEGPILSFKEGLIHLPYAWQVQLVASTPSNPFGLRFTCPTCADA